MSATASLGLRWTLLAFGVLASGYVIANLAGRGWGAADRVQASTQPAIAHTVSLVESSTDSTGASGRARIIKAVRGDGASSTVYQDLDAAGNVKQEMREIVFADRLATRLDDAIAAKTTRRIPLMKFNDVFLGLQRDATRSCLATRNGRELAQYLGEKFVGNEEIGGVITMHVQSKNSGPQIDQWFAPSHGCALLRQRVRFGNGPIAGESVQELESIISGEPEARFFTIREGLAEVQPSVFHARRWERATGKPGAYNASADAAEDAAYFAQRP